MSQGPFASGAKYEATAENGGGIYRVRVQPETLGLTLNSVANASPAGAINQTVGAKVSGGRNSIGMNCALVRLQWTGTVPAGYDAQGTLTLPLLTQAIRAAVTIDSTGTYLGEAVEVVGLTPEKVR